MSENILDKFSMDFLRNQVLKNADEISKSTKQNFEKLFDLIFAETE